jgi:malate synthase
MQIIGEIHARYEEILSPETLEFLADLHENFNPARLIALEIRENRQQEINSGAVVDFLEETTSIREDSWQVASPAPGLEDRRCEITGPTDRRMTINALNSGARVWMADFEDSNTPTWENLVGGQINLGDAIDRTIEFVSPDGREYRLNETLATIVVRPRGWHLEEKHLLIDGESISGSLFDFGCYVMTCVAESRRTFQRPYFYLPKTESHLEAHLWNDIFTYTEDRFGLERGTIRATVLIETILAAFEMDEILFELREHSAGLNAGRWDYLFSLIKKFAYQGGSFVLPDRNSVTMTAPFMRAYSELLVKTCHRRGAHAIGGMAAFIPSRRDPEVNAVAMAKVKEDKNREANAGFDGSWVAHPDLVPICTEVFDSVLGAKPNQIDRQRDDVHVVANDLLNLSLPDTQITEAGLRNNISVGLRYLAAWLRGFGAVAIFNLMEDVATAEISRSQVWQWLRFDIALETDAIVTEKLVTSMIDEELETIAEEFGDAYDQKAFEHATQLFKGLVFTEEFSPFLTLSAYDQIS